MTYYKQTAIHCDGEECLRNERNETTATKLREELREEGWKVSQPGGKDYCPECANDEGVRRA